MRAGREGQEHKVVFAHVIITPVIIIIRIADHNCTALSRRDGADRIDSQSSDHVLASFCHPTWERRWSHHSGAMGPRAAVAELGEQLWRDYQHVAKRDLRGYEIVYLFVDGIAERIRPGQRREPVMAAWGFTATGGRVLLHLKAGSKEDAETVSAFAGKSISRIDFRSRSLQGMRARGLGDPLLDFALWRGGRDQGDRDLLPTLRPPALPRPGGFCACAGPGAAWNVCR